MKPSRYKSVVNGCSNVLELAQVISSKWYGRIGHRAWRSARGADERDLYGKAEDWKNVEERCRRLVDVILYITVVRRRWIRKMGVVEGREGTTPMQCPSERGMWKNENEEDSRCKVQH